MHACKKILSNIDRIVLVLLHGMNLSRGSNLQCITNPFFADTPSVKERAQ